MFFGHLDQFQKNRLLEVGLIQNRETMALRLLTTIDFLYLSCVNTHKNKEIIEIAFGWGLGHIWNLNTLEGRWPHFIHDVGGVLGRPLDTFF